MDELEKKSPTVSREEIIIYAGIWQDPQFNYFK